MKKVLAGLMVAAVVAAVAQAAETKSANAVGFINKEASAGKLYALTVPFTNMDSDDGYWLFKDTQIAKDAARGSIVYFWNGMSWDPYTSGRSGFTTDYKLKPGECFFFEPSTDMILTMAGEVPDDASVGVAVTGGGNLSAVANPFPTPMNFKESSLATDKDLAARGAIVYFWNGESWDPYTSGRSGFTVEREVQPGEGFFFETTSGTDSKEWSVEIPYEL